MGEETTGDLLMAAARGLRRRYVDVLAPYDVTPGQSRGLTVVCEQGPLRLSDLAEALGIVPRSATQVADALEQRGLLRRNKDPADRRATVLVATPEGRRLHDVIAAARTEESDVYLAALPADARAELHRVLRQLVRGS